MAVALVHAELQARPVSDARNVAELELEGDLLAVTVRVELTLLHVDGH